MQPMHVQQQPGLTPGFQSEVNLRANGAQAQRRPQESMNPPIPVPVEAADLPVEDLDALRTREITAKAVSGILLTLLKWFKVSRMLSPVKIGLSLTISRHPQIRISDPTSSGLELSPPRPKAVRPSGS
jgi:hypothetical protein